MKKERISELLEECRNARDVDTLVKDKNTPDYSGESRSLQDVMKILDFNLISEINRRLAESQVQVLDLGCGVGRALWELSANFLDRNGQLGLNGVYYKESIPFSKKRIGEYFRVRRAKVMQTEYPFLTPDKYDITTSGVVPKLFNSDATKKLPFESDSINVIYSTMAFHYFCDKIGAIAEVVRVLQPSGIAAIVIDRTDRGFWDSSLRFPRLRIENENAESYLKKKLKGICDVSVRKTGIGKSLYTLILEKKSSREADFSDIEYSKEQSINLNRIRDLDHIGCHEESLPDVPEFKKLTTMGQMFLKKPRREYFGGFLSFYKHNH